MRPQQVNQSYDLFRARLEKLFKNTSEQDAALPTSKDGLLALLGRAVDLSRSTSSLDLHRLMQASAADESQSNDAVGDQTGRRIKKQADRFSHFVEAFSKVVEVVATAGKPYANVAYQTLAVLVIVCMSNKVESDNKVVELFDEVAKALPRPENWQAIYPTDSSRRAVAESYRLILDLSQRVAEYLASARSKHSHFPKEKKETNNIPRSKAFKKTNYTSERFSLSLFPSRILHFTPLLARIHTHLSALHHDALHGAHARAASALSHLRDVQAAAAADRAARAEMQAAVRLSRATGDEAENVRVQLLQRTEALQAQIEHQRFELSLRAKQEDDRRLAAFEDWLGPRMRTAEGGEEERYQLGLAKAFLMRMFPDLPPNPRRVPCTGYIQATRQRLQLDDDDGGGGGDGNGNVFRRWMDYQGGPALLYLAGRTHPMGTRHPPTSASWLSPFAIHMAEDLQRAGCKVMFLSCLPEAVSSSSSPSSFSAAAAGEGAGGGGGSNGTSTTAPPPPTLAAVAASVAMQALRWKPEVLRESEGQLHRILSTKAGTARSVDAVVELMKEVLRRVAAAGGPGGEGEPIYVILDRMDRCMPGVVAGEDGGNENDGENSLVWIMNQLCGVIGKLGAAGATAGGEGAAPPVRVKIAVVAEESSLSISSSSLSGRGGKHRQQRQLRPWSEKEVDPKVCPAERIFARRRWDQDILPVAELQRMLLQSDEGNEYDLQHQHHSENESRPRIWEHDDSIFDELQPFDVL